MLAKIGTPNQMLLAQDQVPFLINWCWFPNCGIPTNRISPILDHTLYMVNSCDLNHLKASIFCSQNPGVCWANPKMFAGELPSRNPWNPGVSRVAQGFPQGFPQVFCKSPAGNRLNDLFRKEMQTRGASIVKARKASSAMSTARAIVDHLKDLHLGTRVGALEFLGCHHVPPWNA